MENNIERIPVEENKKSLINTLIEYTRNNKYISLLVLLVVILIFVIFAILGINAHSPQKNVSNKVIPNPTSNIINISPTGINIDDTQKKTIINQIKPQIDQVVATKYDVSKVKAYGEIWAMVEIKSPDTDPANVVLKKENGEWKVVLGPGTHFDSTELQGIGAPENLIKDSNISF